jgi:nucleoside-diphosphate-sugar epimerase
MEADMTKTVLVLGATGGIGGETARALARRGWQVRALTRRLRDGMDDFDWRIGDAMDRDAVVAAAAGVDAIVHAVNPTAYRGWGKLVLPMIDNSIAAAQASDARLMLPGTIYNYDPATTPLAAPDAPQHSRTRKGAIRVEMEARIARAGVRALILRAGDFFGPRPGQSWFNQGMVTPGKPVTSILYPGARGVGHGWAYLPDVAETVAQLLDREEALPRFARHHFAGHFDRDGRAMIDAVARAIGNPDLSVRGFPWVVLPLLGLFSEMLREMTEMKPYWRNPVALDNTTLVAALGAEPHTPLDAAVRTTLEALGCLGGKSDANRLHAAHAVSSSLLHAHPRAY